MHVGLSVEPDRGTLRGLVLKLGTSRFECILDPDLVDLPSDGSPPSPVHTLDCWLAELERLAVGGGPVMLPFNFSDQCTGWLRIGPLDDGLVEVQAGWSSLGQYDRDFSDFISVGRHLPDFEPVRNAKIERPLADIVAAVVASRTDLAARLQPGEES